MNGERTVIDSFREIERKHSGILSSAEADEARERIVTRFQKLADAPDIQEFRCPMHNDWDTTVFHERRVL